MTRGARAAAARVSLVALLLCAGVRAEGESLTVLSEQEAARTRASRYANLSDADALAQLDARHVPYERVESAPGVRCPIRLRGPLHGVDIHGALPPEERATAVFEILDARLALALDDFAEVLSHHDVIELVHFTIYRPAHDERQEAKGGLARHPGGMAIDVGALRKRSGMKLTVGVDWAPGIGSKTCGLEARKLVTRRGRELESIACEAADLRLFHGILTPHYNRAHHDHLHLEIRPDTRWFIVR